MGVQPEWRAVASATSERGTDSTYTLLYIGFGVPQPSLRPGKPQKLCHQRSFTTPVKASLKIEVFILEVPRTRSSKVIGTSTTVKPRQ